MSFVYTGVIGMFLLPALGQLGFSEACGSEIVQFALALPGAILALYGRYRLGGITAFGKRV